MEVSIKISLNGKLWIKLITLLIYGWNECTISKILIILFLRDVNQGLEEA